MGRTRGEVRESFVSEFKGKVVFETVGKNQTEESVNRVGSVLSVNLQLCGGRMEDGGGCRAW